MLLQLHNQKYKVITPLSHCVTRSVLIKNRLFANLVYHYDYYYDKTDQKQCYTQNNINQKKVAKKIIASRETTFASNKYLGRNS